MKGFSPLQRALILGSGAVVVWALVFGWLLSDGLERGLRERAGWEQVSPGMEEAPDATVQVMAVRALIEDQRETVWLGVLGGAVLLLFVMGFTVTPSLRMERQVREMEEMSLQFLTSLAGAVDAKNPWTRGHSERTTRYAVRIGRRMGLSKEVLDDLRFASLLHDVGSVTSREEAVPRPEPLTEEERDVIRQLPGRGEKILEGVTQFRRILPVIRSFRERYDGTGYPDSRGGETIPLLARIVHVAEAYDAMVEDRPYRPGSGQKYAREELIRHSGTQFDPRVVDVFLKILAGEDRAEK